MIQLPTFARSAITANSNKHLLLRRRKTFWLSACASESIVNGSHESVTEIVEKMISPVLFGINRSFKH